MTGCTRARVSQATGQTNQTPAKSPRQDKHDTHPKYEPCKSGQWNDDDYDVLADDVVVGRNRTDRNTVDVDTSVRAAPRAGTTRVNTKLRTLAPSSVSWSALSAMKCVRGDTARSCCNEVRKQQRVLGKDINALRNAKGRGGNRSSARPRGGLRQGAAAPVRCGSAGTSGSTSR